MPKINVNITNVAAMSNRIKGVRFNKVQDVRTNVINVRNTLDSRVAEYRLRGMDNIFNRLTWVHSSIYNAETDLRIIEDILERAYELYDMAESNLEKEVSKLDDKRSSSLHEFMIAYQSVFGNDSAFSSTHKGSSGRTHGGGGRSFGNSVSHGGGGRSFGNGSGGGGRYFDEETAKSALNVLNELYGKSKKAISTVPVSILSINSFSEQTVKKYDDIIGSFKSLSELKDIILNAGDKSELTNQLAGIKVASTVVDFMEYSYQTVEFIDAAANKDALRASEAIKEIGLDLLKDTIFKGPAKKAGMNIIVSAIENGTESYLEFCSDPTVENFGNMIYSSTLNSLDEGVMKTAYDIVKNVPGVGSWMTGEYERLSGKSGVEGVIDCQRRLLNEMIESSDGFNGWLEGMELMGKGIKKGVVNAKNAVVNGFKSIFT